MQKPSREETYVFASYWSLPPFGLDVPSSMRGVAQSPTWSHVTANPIFSAPHQDCT